MKDSNHIRIINKNPKFLTHIYYNKVWNEFVVLLDNRGGEMLFGERFKTAKQVFNWVLRNIDDSGTDYNIVFMYRTDWDTSKKGRLYYELDDCNYTEDNDFKKLLYLLI